MVGGTTEVTTKNSFTKQISFEWGQNLDLQNHLVNLLNQVNDRLKKYYPASKLVFCPLIGTDLARVVNSHPVSAEDQIIVDNAIWEFNSQVLRVNEERETFFPALHQQVHRFCKGKQREHWSKSITYTSYPRCTFYDVYTI